MESADRPWDSSEGSTLVSSAASVGRAAAREFGLARTDGLIWASASAAATGVGSGAGMASATPLRTAERRVRRMMVGRLGGWVAG